MHGPQPGQQPPPLTVQDWKKIQKSMKKPEFLGLLSEYMVQISDPKNKQQYDDYLRQMQTDGQLPKHMKLIQPQPQFCIKTGLISERNKSQEMKFFINMCSAEEIEKPSFETKMSETGEVGQSWKIPNSMGKIRYDQDKNGAVCNTVDAVFHPETFAFAKNKKFEAMINNIAIQTAQRQLGERKETLSKDYIVMQKLKCKGGQPAILPIRQIEGKTYSKGEGGEQQRDRDGAETKMQKQIMDQKKQNKMQKQKQEETKKKQQITQQELTQSPLSILPTFSGPQRPQYSTIYTYPVQYIDFIQGGVNKTNKHPTSINIEFKLPLVEQFKQIKSLDINEQKILLDAGGKYFIDLELKNLKVRYKLKSGQSKAKFDKKKRCLRVTIPIDMTSIKEEENKIQTATISEVPTQQQHQVEEQQVVEDKTWQDKNKLLEISEPSVSLHVLNKTEIEEKEQKKFVQEIDEDDINQNEISKQKQQIKQASISEQPKTLPLPQTQLSFKFQQIRQKSFIIINLPKYKKEQVSLIITSTQILLVWDSPTGAKYLNAIISKEVEEKDVQVVYVVDFVVINVAKKGDLEKVGIERVEIKYEEFRQKFEREREGVREREETKKKEEEEKKEAEKSARVQKEGKEIESEAREIKGKSTTAIESRQNIVLKKTLNPQFLHFKISIVDQLD